jgi:hypothetical protein
MGKRQRKNRLIYRACLVIFLIKSSSIYSQKGTCVINLQNAFYQEFSLFDKEKQLTIHPARVSFCDSLAGVLKPIFLETNKQDTSQNIWQVRSIFSFDYEDGVYAFVNVEKMKDTFVLSKETFSFFKNENCWMKKEIPELVNIKTVTQTLKPDSFWAFYNSEPSGIKEIDAIKANFKNTEGILDIDKLGAYLKTKPKALAKYCDY